MILTPIKANAILYTIPTGLVGFIMKISMKGQYGIKAMLDLAMYSKGQSVALKQIAERQNISDRYLEQVFSLLRKGGFVKSIKGPQGGYMLDCDPVITTVYDLLNAIEGQLSFSYIDDQIDELDECINETVWDELDKRVIETLCSVTIVDLVEKYHVKVNKSTFMYYI
tara:strand:- start:72 stop:575 length:504 start_codon:yes stop_codon:yes gene_type:complete